MYFRIPAPAKGHIVLSRREFLKSSGQAAIALGMAGLPMTEAEAFGRKSLEETLKPENYAKLTKNWDPIYGPELRRDPWYGGLSNFDGHNTHPEGRKGPGLDYDVPVGVPLVPATAFFLLQNRKTQNDALIMLAGCLSTTKYILECVHIDEFTLNKPFTDDAQNLRTGKPFRALLESEIVAISGNTGKYPDGSVLFPHLHFSFSYKKDLNPPDFMDSEKFGLDCRKPVFSDGEAFLAPNIKYRIPRLEKKLEGLEDELNSWPEELSELKGRLLEHYKLMGDAKGQKIVDSKHFHDMRALLKLCTLETKTFIPGSKPYSLMLGILGYSMVPPYSSQEVILTLPFIAPGVVHKYKPAVYENGPFYQLKDNKIIPVTK